MLFQLFGFPVFRNAWFSRRVIDILAKPIMETGIIESNSPLADRESEEVYLMAKGYANNKIAEALATAKGTVKNHLVNIYQKLEVNSRAEAVASVWQHEKTIARKRIVETSSPLRLPEGSFFMLHFLLTMTFDQITINHSRNQMVFWC